MRDREVQLSHQPDAPPNLSLIHICIDREQIPETITFRTADRMTYGALGYDGNELMSRRLNLISRS